MSEKIEEGLQRIFGKVCVIAPEERMEVERLNLYREKFKNIFAWFEIYWPNKFMKHFQTHDQMMSTVTAWAEEFVEVEFAMLDAAVKVAKRTLDWPPTIAGFVKILEELHGKHRVKKQSSRDKLHPDGRWYGDEWVSAKNIGERKKYFDSYGNEVSEALHEYIEIYPMKSIEDAKLHVKKFLGRLDKEKNNDVERIIAGSESSIADVGIVAANETW